MSNSVVPSMPPVGMIGSTSGTFGVAANQAASAAGSMAAGSMGAGVAVCWDAGVGVAGSTGRVKTGGVTTQGLRIEDGLFGGEDLIVNPPPELTDGARVEPRQG